MTARPAGSREDLIVYLATGWWDGPAGTDRQLATALGRYGPVLYVDPPISGLTRFLKPQLGEVAAAPRLRSHTPHLTQLVTRVTPGMTRPVLRHLRAPLVHRAVRSAVRDLFGPTGRVAAVISSRVDESWPHLPARHRLLHVTDDLVAGAELLGLPRDRLIRLENAALAGADKVTVVSPGLRDRYAAAGLSPVLVPNGCSPEFYAKVDHSPPPVGLRLSGPVAGFVGHINDRIDLALLEGVADTGCPLLIVGPLAHGYQQAARFEALAGRPNVHWAGPRPYEEMPSYLRLIDVGLTPYADNPFNRASFPLKTLEYLAAGRAVVATSLPAHVWLDTGLVTRADGPADFAEAVTAALARPRTPGIVRARRAFAERHSWSVRAERMAELLGLVSRTTVA
jgi:teichuronic acid biosynthesis glycosyltransferase TuaH